MRKTVVRRSVVVKALTALAQQQEQLAAKGAVTVRVYVDCRLTPESFPARVDQGAVVLHFTRSHLTDKWQLDTSQFTMLPGL